MLAKKGGESKNGQNQLELSKGHCNASLCSLKNLQLYSKYARRYIGQKGISTDNIVCIGKLKMQFTIKMLFELTPFFASII